MDPAGILVENFGVALSQLNRYLALGLLTAISALLLDRTPPGSPESRTVTVQGVIVPMPQEAAKLLLLGIAFVAGALACVAAEQAVAIAGRLRAMPDVLEAVCTYSSVATAPRGYRVFAILLPLAFAAPIFVRMWTRIRATDSAGGRGILVTAAFFGVPYVALGIVMLRLPCSM
jgi:hypothetical protein